jgi:hypothetical protein
MTGTTILWWTAGLNVAAIITAPITALWVQRKGDDNRALKRRREDIFRALWINRARPMYLARVDSLNMIDVEFFGVAKVMDAWADLLAHYNTDYIAQGVPTVEIIRLHVEKYSALLYEMSQVLGYKFGKTYIRDGAYRPGIHNEIDDLELETRRLIRDLLKELYAMDALPIRVLNKEETQQIVGSSPQQPPTTPVVG